MVRFWSQMWLIDNTSIASIKNDTATYWSVIPIFSFFFFTKINKRDIDTKIYNITSFDWVGLISSETHNEDPLKSNVFYCSDKESIHPPKTWLMQTRCNIIPIITRRMFSHYGQVQISKLKGRNTQQVTSNWIKYLKKTLS